MVLPLDAGSDEIGAVSDFVVVDAGPGILGHADFVAADRISDAREAQALRVSELDDGGQVDEEQPLSLLHEGGQCLVDFGRTGLTRPIEAAQQRRGELPPDAIAGLRDRHMPDARIVDDESIWQVAFLVHDPYHGVEEGSRRGPVRPRAGLVREHERSGECLMLGTRENIVADDQSRGEVGDHSDRTVGDPRAPDHPLHDFREQLEPRRGGAIASSREAELCQQCRIGRGTVAGPLESRNPATGS